MRDHNEVFESVIRQRDEALNNKTKQKTPAVVWVRVLTAAACIAVAAGITVPLALRLGNGSHESTRPVTDYRIIDSAAPGVFYNSDSAEFGRVPEGTENTPDKTGSDTKKSDTGKEAQTKADGTAAGNSVPASAVVTVRSIADSTGNECVARLIGLLPPPEIEITEWKAELNSPAGISETTGTVSLYITGRPTGGEYEKVSVLWTWKHDDMSVHYGMKSSDKVAETDEAVLYIRYEN
ncbi:MAG: hypothetical protein J5563_01975 [Clostridia bacterium]|nr:hypothetical protein [Clostridia bacterium]